MQLHGTIPISYRAQTYHIPIVVWFPLEYPRRPPLVYVTPTRDMSIRKSKEVEPSGKVGGEMVDMWERKWEVCQDDPPAPALEHVLSEQSNLYCRFVLGSIFSSNVELDAGPLLGSATCLCKTANNADDAYTIVFLRCSS